MAWAVVASQALVGHPAWAAAASQAIQVHTWRLSLGGLCWRAIWVAKRVMLTCMWCALYPCHHVHVVINLEDVVLSSVAHASTYDQGKWIC
jgi:hypothetical protein